MIIKITADFGAAKFHLKGWKGLHAALTDNTLAFEVNKAAAQVAHAGRDLFSDASDPALAKIFGRMFYFVRTKALLQKIHEHTRTVTRLPDGTVLSRPVKHIPANFVSELDDAAVHAARGLSHGHLEKDLEEIAEWLLEPLEERENSLIARRSAAMITELAQAAATERMKFRYVQNVPADPIIGGARFPKEMARRAGLEIPAYASPRLVSALNQLNVVEAIQAIIFQATPYLEALRGVESEISELRSDVALPDIVERIEVLVDPRRSLFQNPGAISFFSSYPNLEQGLKNLAQKLRLDPPVRPFLYGCVTVSWLRGCKSCP